jgi:hypothetical protein
MSYNELFENVLSEAEEDIDFLSEPLEPISFVGTPLIYESVLFERVLKEAHLQEMAKLSIDVGIKNIINLIAIIPLRINSVFFDNFGLILI